MQDNQPMCDTCGVPVDITEAHSRQRDKYKCKACTLEDWDYECEGEPEQ